MTAHARTARRATTIAGAQPHGRVVVVPALIAVNVAIFALTVAQAGDLTRNANAELFRAWSLLPLYVGVGEWWRLVTAGFLHFGPIHLLFNMLALWIIGRDLETVLGRARFLAVYFVGLLGGSAAAFVLGAVTTQVAGASGAVFGLMGGLAVVLRRLRRRPGPVLTIIAINVAISVVIPGISLLGHLGGLVVGAAATAAMVYAPARSRVGWQVGAVLGLVLVLVVVMAVRAMTLFA